MPRLAVALRLRLAHFLHSSQQFPTNTVFVNDRISPGRMSYRDGTPSQLYLNIVRVDEPDRVARSTWKNDQIYSNVQHPTIGCSFQTAIIAKVLPVNQHSVKESGNYSLKEPK